VARSYLLHASTRINRCYWYQWNNSAVGALWKPSSTDPSGPGTLLKPGISYRQVYQWTVGATLQAPCSANGSIWTCTFTRPNGYVAQPIWDTAESCANGSCTTIGHTINSKFIKYRDLNGKTVTITGTMVPIGYKPILLKNQ